MTDVNIASHENEYLTNLFTSASVTMTEEQQSTDNVFMDIYIPRTLQELSLEEIEKQKKERSTTLYSKLTGMGTEGNVVVEGHEETSSEEENESEEE